MWKVSKFLKAGCLVVTITSVVVLIIVGGVSLNRKFHLHRGKVHTAEKDEGESPIIDCYPFARNMDQYWACLVDGPEAFFNPPMEEKPVENSDDWGFHIYKRKTLNTVRKKRNVRQSMDKPTDIIIDLHKPYKPFDSQYSFNFTPNTEISVDRQNDDDPFYSQSPYLYKHLGANHPTQQNPPWSYHGDGGPKKWHELDLQKFFVPIRKPLTLELASMVDPLMERLFTTDPGFRNMFLPYKNTLYRGKKMPAYITNYNPANPSKERVYVTNIPNEGYYSFMRFKLPPKALQPDIDNYKRTGVLPPDFVLPPGSEFPNFEELFNVFNFIRGKIVNNQRRTGDENDALRDYLNRSTEYLKTRGHQIKDYSSVKDVLNLIDLMGFEIHALSKGQVVEQRRRSEVGIPLLPVRFPVCDGKEPSPLDIVTSRALRSSLTAYRFGRNFDKSYKFELHFEGDGTTLLQVLFLDVERLLGKSISMTGGAVKGSDLYFEVMQIRFGDDKNSGTEHRLNGTSYGMELQFIFSNKGTDPQSPYFQTLGRAQNDLFSYREKLVIILAVLVEVVVSFVTSIFSPPYCIVYHTTLSHFLKPKENATNPYLFEPLAQAAYKFREQRENHPNGEYNELYRQYSTGDYALRLSDFIPHDSTFYTYRGGLSFPPCFSYVLWSVFEKRLQITEEQFTEFRLMPAVGRDDTNHVAGNIRRIEDEWVKEEHAEGILPSDQAILRKKRQERTVLKSLNPSETNGDDASSQYDYYYDYDSVEGLGPSSLLVAVGLILHRLFRILILGD